MLSLSWYQAKLKKLQSHLTQEFQDSSSKGDIRRININFWSPTTVCKTKWKQNTEYKRQELLYSKHFLKTKKMLSCSHKTFSHQFLFSCKQGKWNFETRNQKRTNLTWSFHFLLFFFCVVVWIWFNMQPYFTSSKVCTTLFCVKWKGISDANEF